VTHASRALHSGTARFRIDYEGPMITALVISLAVLSAPLLALVVVRRSLR